MLVSFLVFDLLSADGRDMRRQPYHQRRESLAELVPRNTAQLQLVPSTTDPTAARQWLDPAYGAVGIEGVVAKRRRRVSHWSARRLGPIRATWSPLRPSLLN